ncbi:hypothetical protein [Thalassotalea euphylliae]|uniref:Flagellar biosynthesis protein FlgE n=1 Tax=Thalassotalea euphylliae TaxID=1655234 RepID=A0A3E0UBB9_9GAMM|nr:hypothetical protein [Thalassotalea euphylliae]REL31102.1 hypothetical protein DXX94_10485 [Thalassotalea euphylliae]REL34014.1 hypothetical protein DXX92_00830 [Thalassotalea euphylliae]
MDVQSAFNAGLQGFTNANQRLNETAANIVDATTITEQERSEFESQAAQAGLAGESEPNLTEEVVNLRVAEFQARASAEVIQTADETLGTLLDVTA